MRGQEGGRPRHREVRSQLVHALAEDNVVGVSICVGHFARASKHIELSSSPLLPYALLQFSLLDSFTCDIITCTDSVLFCFYFHRLFMHSPHPHFYSSTFFLLYIALTLGTNFTDLRDGCTGETKAGEVIVRSWALRDPPQGLHVRCAKRQHTALVRINIMHLFCFIPWSLLS